MNSTHMLDVLLGTGDTRKNILAFTELKLLLCLLSLFCEFMEWQYDELLDRCHLTLNST